MLACQFLVSELSRDLLLVIRQSLLCSLTPYNDDNDVEAASINCLDGSADPSFSFAEHSGIISACGRLATPIQGLRRF